MFLKMQRQLMDLTNFSEGTILANIIKINEEMSEKLKIKVDLRQENCIENTEAVKTELQVLEDKMDYYIVEFKALNSKNEDILEEAFQKNDKNFNEKIRVFEQRLKKHIENLDDKQVNDEKMKN